MRSPALDGTITSSKTEQKTGSVLNSSHGTSKAMVRKLEKQQSSVALLSVDTGQEKTRTGGGREVGNIRSKFEHLEEGHEPQAAVAIGAEANQAAIPVVNVPRGDAGGVANGGGDGGGINNNNNNNNSVAERVPPTPETYEGYFEVPEKDDDEFGKKPKGLKKRFHYYVRKMGCGTSQVFHLEDAMPVVVFGATGSVGGAVARALLRDYRFCVRAVTRTPTTDQARALAEDGAVVVPADFNDTRSLVRAMEGAAGVFLTTNFWESMSKQKELTHGMNVIDAAVSCNIHHFIFHGSEPTQREGKPCGFMDAKAGIEEYVKQTTLPFTAVRIPFLYENFLSLFKPHLVRPGIYTLPVPMEDMAMDCMALNDVARCVVNIFLRPRNHMMKAVNLTGERWTMKHMAEVFNKNFDDRKIIYHKISPLDYTNFDFPGAQDIAALFEHVQSSPPRDVRITRRIYGSHVILDKWVHEHKEQLLEAMKGGNADSS